MTPPKPVAPEDDKKPKEAQEAPPVAEEKPEAKKLSKKNSKELAKQAVAKQCQCDVDELEDLSEKEENGFAFKFKDDVFKVLLEQDFSNTLTKCWNVAVEEIHFFIYLQAK